MVVVGEGERYGVAALAVGVSIFLSVLLWIGKSWNVWRYERPLMVRKGVKLPSGSLGWPIIGEMLEFLTCFKGGRPDQFLRMKVARYGKREAYKTHLLGAASIITVSPQVNKFVLSRDDVFGSGWPGRGKLMGHNSLVCVTGELHKRLRRYLSDAIASPEGMKRAIPRMEVIIRSSLERWASTDGGRINIRSCTKAMSFEIILENFLSLKPSPETEEIEHHYNNLMKGIRALEVYIPGTAHYDAVNSRRWLARKFHSMMDERRRTKGTRGDFLESLMNATDEHGNKLTDEEISDNLVAFVLAGHESTSYTIMWVMIFLDKQPECLAKLKEEHEKITEQKGGYPFSLSDTRQMKYTSHVLDETLRIANIAPFLFRTALKDVEHEGIFFPKGWKILPWVRAPHMDPAYFDEPEKFNPDRWEDPVLKAGVFNPFGNGSRTCVGNLFAKLQVSMFLHYASLDYTWERLTPNARVDFLPHPKPGDGGPAIFKRISKPGS